MNEWESSHARTSATGAGKPSRIEREAFEILMAPSSAPLSRFPIIRTSSIREAETALGRILLKPSIEIENRQEPFHVSLSSYRSPQLQMTHCRYGAAMNVTVPATNAFCQLFPIAGNRATEVDGKRIATSAHDPTGTVISPGTPFKVAFGVGYEQLALRVQAKALVRKLTAIIGEPVDAPLRMELVQNLAAPEARSLRDQFRFLVAEVNRAESPPPLVVNEWEQALMVAFLCGNRHNYSHALQHQPRDLAPWQVRRAEEYIAAHWNQPIRIEDLATVSGVSSRSLFRTFRRIHGCSPMAFARRIRLSHARRLLLSAPASGTVTDIAFECGFSDLGRFSKEFRRTFGELPSEVLKRRH